MSQYTDVQEFHRKFWPEFLPDRPGFEHIQQAFVSLRHAHEELDELADALERRDIVATLDAVIDTVYVLYGLAARLGLPVDEAWTLVHKANLRKARGPGKRGIVDVVKPPSWLPPDLASLFAASSSDE